MDRDIFQGSCGKLTYVPYTIPATHGVRIQYTVVSCCLARSQYRHNLTPMRAQLLVRINRKQCCGISVLACHVWRKLSICSQRLAQSTLARQGRAYLSSVWRKKGEWKIHHTNQVHINGQHIQLGRNTFPQRNVQDQFIPELYPLHFFIVRTGRGALSLVFFLFLLLFSSVVMSICRSSYLWSTVMSQSDEQNVSREELPVRVRDSRWASTCSARVYARSMDSLRPPSP